MPAFDPVRDAAANSPTLQQNFLRVDTTRPPPNVHSNVSTPSTSLGRRATDLTSLLNAEPQRSPSHASPSLSRSSSLFHLIHTDDAPDLLGTALPLKRVDRSPSPERRAQLHSSPIQKSPDIQERKRHSDVAIPLPTQTDGGFARRASGTTKPASREILNPSPPRTPNNKASAVVLSEVAISPLGKRREPSPTRLREPLTPPRSIPPQEVSTSASPPAKKAKTAKLDNHDTQKAHASPTTISTLQIPYNPTSRRTAPNLVSKPLTPKELEYYRTYRGKGTQRLSKRKRNREGEHEDGPPPKKLEGDVGLVVNHYNSRRDVGVLERQESPIIGLRAFNNWVKTVLIMRFAQEALINSPIGKGGRSGKGKVLDIGCGKGGDLNKWAKAKVAEYIGIDIAGTSIAQAADRWRTMKGHRFTGQFEELDCYTDPITKVLSKESLQHAPFDVVSMQFCMHYAFESVQKVRIMLENVARYLRPGGVFVGTIPNDEQLLQRLADIPSDASDLAFGNAVYQIRFEEKSKRRVYGDKYWFYLKDAVEDVPEYVVNWREFTSLANEFKLDVVYHKEFHEVFEEHQEHPEFGPLMMRMGVVDKEGESHLDEDQWEATSETPL